MLISGKDMVQYFFLSKQLLGCSDISSHSSQIKEKKFSLNILVLLGWDYWETVKTSPPIIHDNDIGTSKNTILGYVYRETAGDALIRWTIYYSF